MKRRVVGVWVAVIMALTGAVVATVPAVAQQATSPNYSVDEVFFGNGGELNACSGSYCAKQSAGETAVGNSASNNYQTQAGNNTRREEYIEVAVTPANVNLGNLSTSTAATATSAFSVKAYLASGYTVVNASDPPKYAGYTLNNLTAPTASSPGTEQFGINLVANTSPTTFGAAAVQSPDATFGFGAAATGYNVANSFKYVKGDVIASSTKSSGYTNYTISYLYNISSLTPAGTYNFNHVIVATATF